MEDENLVETLEDVLETEEKAGGSAGSAAILLSYNTYIYTFYSIIQIIGLFSFMLKLLIKVCNLILIFIRFGQDRLQDYSTQGFISLGMVLF